MWQGCCGIVDADKVNSSMKIELMDSPSCGNQQDGKVHSMDDNASTTEPVEEAVSQERATSSGQCSACYVGKHRHSPSRSAGRGYILNVLLQMLLHMTLVTSSEKEQLFFQILIVFYEIIEKISNN